MLLAEVVATSAAVAATRSRKAKVAALAELLGRVGAAEGGHPDLVAVVTAYLCGALRQRRTGLGWRGLQDLPEPTAEPTLTVTEVDRTFARIAALAGPGSQAARSEATRALFAAATPDEQHYLRGLVTGEVRQGASESLVQEALAAAAEVPAAAVRRAAMLAGSTIAVAPAALLGGADAEQALADVHLEVGRPVLPMLASSATSVAEAMAKAQGRSRQGRSKEKDPADTPVAVDTKLDGIRIQVHRHHDGDREEVLVVTRSLEDITARMPEVVEVVRALPVRSAVLDGEVLALDDQGRPRPFQETASRTATHGVPAAHLTPYFFDLLHLDGRDLVDAPGDERLAELARVVPEEHLVPRVVTADVAEAEAFTAEVLARGHEGVVVKGLAAPYDAGRRGAAWVKVKPVHTLDLVVLAVEWGSGRRRGWLSNIHLGARSDGDADAGFVMLGKTFKGMTDEMLAWQTERFLALETHREGHVVHVRPEQVVEIAFDGLQRSTRYPGGLALRFARVVRYRDDKSAEDADTIETVRTLAGGS